MHLHNLLQRITGLLFTGALKNSGFYCIICFDYFFSLLRLNTYTVPTAPKATRSTIPIPKVADNADSPVFVTPRTEDFSAAVSVGAVVPFVEEGDVASRLAPSTNPDDEVEVEVEVEVVVDAVSAAADVVTAAAVV